VCSLSSTSLLARYSIIREIFFQPVVRLLETGMVMPMNSLTSIVSAMQSELRVAEIFDYPGSYNGLQLANRSGQVTKVAAAVDACLPVIEAACAAGANLLLVHHGMFWNGQQMITGSNYEKLRLAMEHDLALYSVHLPLDYHQVLGNHVQLGKACGFPEGEIFGDSKWSGQRYAVDLPRETLVSSVTQAVDGARVHLCPGGPERVRNVAVMTGAAGSEIAKIASHGIDTLITGEGPHWSYILAEELGVNIIYAGHYATETFGVKALAAWLEAGYGLPWEFIDHPSGL
jgi:dinuclear metal center YbgI/SA1388 family protein